MEKLAVKIPYTCFNRGYLSPDEVTSSYDRTGKTIYLDSCKNAKVIPVSYFIRHMFDSELEMKHHGLGPDGVKPLAVALVVRYYLLVYIQKCIYMGVFGRMEDLF